VAQRPLHPPSHAGGVAAVGPGHPPPDLLLLGEERFLDPGAVGLGLAEGDEGTEEALDQVAGAAHQAWSMQKRVLGMASSRAAVTGCLHTSHVP